MIKLTYEESTEKRHFAYLFQDLDERLTMGGKKYKLHVLSKEAEQNLIQAMAYPHSSVVFKLSYYLEQIGFYKYIKDNLETIAVGKPSELRKLEEELSKNFILLMKILELREYDTGFGNHLYELFGYERFKTGSLFDLLKSAAKERANVPQSTKFTLKYRQYFREVLYDALPGRRKDIATVLDDKKCPTLVEFEKAFMNIPDIHMTLMNVKKSKIFDQGWSDYALVMDSKVTVCPYCNRQYVTPFLSSSGRVRADLDHFFSKRRYPYFSMSLYNLVPSCKQCNQSLKGEKQFPFDGLHPFEDDMHTHFSFKALPNHIEKNIIIDIEMTNPTSSNVSEYVDMFKLRPLYGYHVNHVEEIIKKKMMYPDEYLKSLLPSSSFQDIEELKSFVVGYVVEEDKINNEPLSKLRRDIAVQMGFIPNKTVLDRTLIEGLRKLIK